MSGLLVSVRSAAEALAAVSGGATVVDIKEPDRGPLGRAEVAVWAAIRQVVPSEIPISVALGELDEWRCRGLETGGGRTWPARSAFAGLAFRKIGCARGGPDWIETWADVRRTYGAGPAWVAVAYADWRWAQAPHPDEVLETALAVPECAGVLVDTWDKSRPSPVDRGWRPWVRHVQRSGRFVTLAGGLDADGIARLASLRPDLFAVRGAACLGGRRGLIDPQRVAKLVQAAAAVDPPEQVRFPEIVPRRA